MTEIHRSNRIQVIKNDLKETITGNKLLHVYGDNTETYKKNRTITVSGNLNEIITNSSEKWRKNLT